jgi:Protein of unknown function (DUF3579)
MDAVIAPTEPAIEPSAEARARRERPGAAHGVVGAADATLAKAAGPQLAPPAHGPIVSMPSVAQIIHRQFLIVGKTLDGKVFRPSDWSERLAGAMSAFRPAGSALGMAAFIGYSPYCVPRTVDGQKCVLVNEALRGIEVLAWDFVMHFARDNLLEVRDVTQGCAPQ